MLELSSTSGYAVLALAFLAGSDGRWVLAKDIAVATGIAGPYLSRILHTLAKAGVIRAKRGYRGGFVLARPAAKIGLLEIVNAVEERSVAPRCLLGLSECSDEHDCPVHCVWKSARTRIEACLQRLTLAEVAPAVRRHTLPASRKARGHGMVTGEPRFAPRSPGQRSGPRSKLAAPRPGQKRVVKRAAMQG
jgi:Rrf2 family protein